MKTLMIVAPDPMVNELEKRLHDTGVNAYSLLNRVEGTVKRAKCTSPSNTLASTS